MDEIYSRISNDAEFGIDFDKNERSEIQEFFNGEVVFLTGCTGFLGKCIVEKLLRGCSSLKKLYLMVRRLEEPVSVRVREYFNHVIFTRVRELIPNFESKIVFIEGNLMEEDFGMSANERKIIINEVTMIIHNASNVKFNAEVNKNLRTNVYGTLYLLNLARECENLKIFTYVSTAYSHSYQQHIEEKCYPPPGDLQFIKDIIKADEACPGSLNEQRVYKLVKPWPNMYTFSKAAAESLVEKAAEEVQFRCLIYRPTIVTSTYQEPIPAWCGNVNGPVAAVIGAGTGIVRALYKANHPLDFVPADMCTNALLAIMWDSVVNRNEKHTALVYNYGSSTVKPLSLFQLQDFVLPRGYELPPSKQSVRPYYLTRTDYLYWYIVLHICMHCIPAVVGDIYFTCLLKQKARLVDLSIRISRQLRIIWIFVNGNWRIHVHETKKMWERMSRIDRHLFYNDLRTLEWEDYGYNYWAGIRQWILKEPNDGGDKEYLKIFNVESKAYWILMKLVFVGPAVVLWYYFNNWVSIILLPFINLARLLCCLL